MHGSVVVTGGLGMIGRALTQHLVCCGYEVRILDRVAPDVAVEILGDLPTCSYSQVDLRCEPAANHLPDHVTTVFHLAALTENRPEHATSHAHVSETVAATANLLDSLNSAAPVTIVLASSQLVYGSRSPRPAEHAPTAPETPFSAAKLASEAFLQAHCAGARHTGIAARLCNVVGPGIGRGIVVDLVGRLSKSRDSLQVLGHGRQRRSYLSSDDCASALVHLATRRLDAFNVFNVANRDALTALEVAQAVANACERAEVDVSASGADTWQGDAGDLSPDISKLLGTGWLPRASSGEAVSRTARWLISGHQPVPSPDLEAAEHA